jgi:hypothetical protein
VAPDKQGPADISNILVIYFVILVVLILLLVLVVLVVLVALVLLVLLVLVLLVLLVVFFWGGSAPQTPVPTRCIRRRIRIFVVILCVRLRILFFLSRI